MPPIVKATHAAAALLQLAAAEPFSFAVSTVDRACAMPPSVEATPAALAFATMPNTAFTAFMAFMAILDSGKEAVIRGIAVIDAFLTHKHSSSPLLLLEGRGRRRRRKKRRRKVLLQGHPLTSAYAAVDLLL